MKIADREIGPGHPVYIIAEAGLAHLGSLDLAMEMLHAAKEAGADAFKTQFLDVIERQCGEQRSMSPEELHGSWMQSYLTMGWVYGEAYDRERRIHPDLVPYALLGQLERDKDAVFVALCEIARQFVYDVEL